jgi:hypothetical protein
VPPRRGFFFWPVEPNVARASRAGREPHNRVSEPIPLSRLGPSITSGPSDVELAMNSRSDSPEPIDHKTCRSICDAVGERLQRDLVPVRSELPPDLAQLMEELRRRDRSASRSS